MPRDASGPVTGLVLIFLLAVCQAASSLPAQEPQAVRPPTQGEPFPLLAFPVLGENRLATLAEYRGKKILLYQFASW